MERDFEFKIQSGGEASSAVDEAYINGVYAGLSFQSLLTYGSSQPVTYGSFDPAAETRNLLKMPKTEPLFTINDTVSDEAPPFNFLSEATPSSSYQHQLPNLVSLELPQYTAESLPLNLGFETTSYERRQQQQQQRRRRHQQRLSDKTRCLQKLLPWDKKMDMATIMEEAYKYIKFLQAQVSVLQSMPNCDSSGNGTFNESGGDLGRLNRQQLLQVVVNSPVAQTMLYSKGCCVYSMEQLVLLKKNAERKALFHHILFASNPNSMIS